MKPKPLFFLLPLCGLMTLAACSTAMGSDEAAVGTAVEADVTLIQASTETAADAVPDGNCPEALPGSHLLMNTSQGICFLYPESYDAVQDEGGAITLYVRSPLNMGAPTASFSFEPAEGRTLAEVAAQRLADYAIPGAESQLLMLGGENAVMLDNLPGQDTNRRVVAIHGDKVYDLVFNRVSAGYGEIGERAETLYAMVSGSWRFISAESNASLDAGPECPDPIANSMLYTNEAMGYCLLLPADYSSLQVDPGATEMAFYIDCVQQDMNHARLYIKVIDANGRSLDKITKEHEAELEAALPGLDVIWSAGHLLDGEAANQFNRAPGQDLSRQVVALHNGRLYTLTFAPDDPAATDTYAEMETLYDLVVDSFSFLWEV